MYQVTRERDGHILTECISEDLAIYLASNRSAMERTAGTNESYIVVYREWRMPWE